MCVCVCVCMCVCVRVCEGEIRLGVKNIYSISCEDNNSDEQHVPGLCLLRCKFTWNIDFFGMCNCQREPAYHTLKGCFIDERFALKFRIRVTRCGLRFPVVLVLIVHPHVVTATFHAHTHTHCLSLSHTRSRGGPLKNVQFF